MAYCNLGGGLLGSGSRSGGSLRSRSGLAAGLTAGHGGLAAGLHTVVVMTATGLAVVHAVVTTVAHAGLATAGLLTLLGHPLSLLGFEELLHFGLFLVGELAVLVGVELLHELGLHGFLLLGGELGTLAAAGLAVLHAVVTVAHAVVTTVAHAGLAAAGLLGHLGLPFSLLGFKSLLHFSLFLVGELTILVGVELLHELGLHFGVLGFKVLLHFSLLFVGELTVLVGVKLLHELGLHGFHGLGVHVAVGALASGGLGGAGLVAAGALGEHGQSGKDAEDDGVLHNLYWLCLGFKKEQMNRPSDL